MQKMVLMMLAGACSLNAWANQTTPVPDVAPVEKGWHVVVNVPQQRLFLYKDGALNKVYPVAVGKALTPTDLGEHTIGAKAFDPTWHIPKSIQKERGDGVQTVPPGPNNPLGPVFVRLGDPKLGLGIHGTNNPASVPGVRSHGCVRMKSPDALQFARTISSGSPATVSYEMAALNTDAANQLWLAAYGDPYAKKNLKTAALKQSIAAWAKANGQTVNMNLVDQVLKARAGKAVCISCKGKAAIKGSLRSLAWNSGSSGYTLPKAVSVKLPVPKDKILPSGSSVEVNVDAASAPAAAIDVKPTSVFD